MPPAANTHKRGWRYPLRYPWGLWRPARMQQVIGFIANMAKI